MLYADVAAELHEPAGRSVHAHLLALMGAGRAVALDGARFAARTERADSTSCSSPRWSRRRGSWPPCPPVASSATCSPISCDGVRRERPRSSSRSWSVSPGRDASGRVAHAGGDLRPADAHVDADGGAGRRGAGPARDAVGSRLRRGATRGVAAALGLAHRRRVGVLERLLGGELRQGASAGVMVDAVARAADVPVALARRALMLGGRLDQLAALALAEGAPGLAGVGLVPGRPLQPMLASTANSTGEAVSALGSASVEWKLDGSASRCTATVTGCGSGPAT